MFYVKNYTLFKIASGSAVVALGLAMFVIRKRENLYQDSSFFLNAMDTLKSNPSAVKLLGSPISGSRVNYVANNSDQPSSVAEFTAYVKGPKSSGVMHFWAEKKLQGDEVKININRVELKIDGDENKRLLVKS